MEITFVCDKCGQSLTVDEAGAGMTIDCPNCGKPTYVPSKSTSPPETPNVPAAVVTAKAVTSQNAPPAILSAAPSPQTTSRSNIPPQPSRVVVTDIQMPFWSMVVFMIKWAVAAVPAFIMLVVIFFIFWALFATIGLGLFYRMAVPH